MLSFWLFPRDGIALRADPSNRSAGALGVLDKHSHSRYTQNRHPVFLSLNSTPQDPTIRPPRLKRGKYCWILSGSRAMDDE